MKYLYVLMGCLFFHKSNAQISFSRLLQNEVAEQYHYRGHFADAIRWKDKAGYHIIVLSYSAVDEDTAASSPNEDTGYQQFLYACAYRGDSLLWQLTDYIKNCTFDLLVEFRKNSLQVTDLDNNGFAESWMMYSKTCASDVSPRVLKLMLHIGSSKYAIRGLSKVKSGSKQTTQRKRLADPLLGKLDKRIQQFAYNLWGKYEWDIFE
jgi:hypothetical protein